MSFCFKLADYVQNITVLEKNCLIMEKNRRQFGITRNSGENWETAWPTPLWGKRSRGRILDVMSKVNVYAIIK